MQIVLFELGILALLAATSRVYSVVDTLDFEGKFYEFACYTVCFVVGIGAWIVWMIQSRSLLLIVCCAIPILSFGVLTAGLAVNTWFYLKAWRSARKEEKSDADDK